MSLPKAELPKYTITLPASKKQIQYRPFTVKEEKILLLAMESKDTTQIITSISQIFDLCTFGICKLEKMNQIDAEFLFVHIRNKSLGEGIDVTHKCASCSHTHEMTLNLDNISVSESIKKDPNIRLADNLVITMSYPTLDKTINLINDDDSISSIARCVDSIMIDDKVYTKEDSKVEDFVEYISGLTQKQVDMLDEFFDSMPKITFDLDYKCFKCGETNHIHMEGLNDFFG